MLHFLLKRAGIGVGLIVVVLTVIFLAVHAVPGDPAAILASGGASGTATPEAIAAVRAKLGLDQPVLVQYGNYLAGVVTGDFGESFRTGRPVLTSIAARLPNTLELVVLACLLGTVVGIALGTLAARRGGVVDTIVNALASLGIATPVYVLGTVLVLLVALRWRLLPAGGFRSWSADPVAHLQLLVLPAIALSLSFTSVVARMTRSSVLETQQMDWVRTARSWGLGPRQVFRRHILRNSLTPVTTSIGLQFGTMLGSTVLAERVFNYPGLSALLVDSVMSRDYPMVQGIVIVISVLFIAINIAVDALYRLLDPRVS
jgi:peptide/nickel transport system permease protein